MAFFGGSPPKKAIKVFCSAPYPRRSECRSQGVSDLLVENRNYLEF